MPKAGGASITLSVSTGLPNHLALDASHVYWTDARRGLVLRVAKAGGEPEILARDQQSPGEIVRDADSVYWIDG